MKPVRVLVVDDSPTARAFLVALLRTDPAIAVVGEAADGEQAVELAHTLRPDVITMDVHMPGMDGLEATSAIMSSVPRPIVVVTSRAGDGDVELSLDVIAAGALMLVEKPEAPSSPNHAAQRDRLLSMVKAMAGVKVVRRWTPVPRVSPGRGATLRRDSLTGPTASIVAIAASTGGPAAVKELLAALPSDLPAPVLLVQHIANGFTHGLVHWLSHSCPLQVKVAEDREALLRGTVYVAPDDYHLGVADERRVQLTQSEPIQGFRPSATHLFHSVARAFGSRVAAVILTGMGSDGVAGLRDVHAAGGLVLAQDESSAVVYGMPREAVHAGVVDASGPPDELARRIANIVTIQGINP